MLEAFSVSCQDEEQDLDFYLRTKTETLGLNSQDSKTKTLVSRPRSRLMFLSLRYLKTKTFVSRTTLWAIKKRDTFIFSITQTNID